MRNGSIRHRRPAPAATAAERQTFTRINKAVENAPSLVNTLHNDFWSLHKKFDVATAGVEFAKAMNSISQNARAVDSAMTAAKHTTSLREADPVLRRTLAKLITKISSSQMQIFDLTEASSDEDKWKAVSHLVRAYEGEVRILHHNPTYWVLTELPPGQKPTTRLLAKSTQFILSPEEMNQTSRSSPFGCFNPSNYSPNDAPAWDLQKVRLAVPCASVKHKEWRLQAQVCSIGQLLVQLGSEFSAADIERYWQSLDIVVMKRNRLRGPRGKKRGRE